MKNTKAISGKRNKTARDPEDSPRQWGSDENLSTMSGYDVPIYNYYANEGSGNITQPTDEQIGEIGQVDLLLIPVGGHSTVDAKKAHQIVDQLSPKLVIPMHNLTGHINREEFPLQSIDSFIEKKTNVSRSHESSLELNADALPTKTEILVLSFTN